MVVDYALANQRVVGARSKDGGCVRYCLEMMETRKNSGKNPT